MKSLLTLRYGKLVLLVAAIMPFMVACTKGNAVGGTDDDEPGPTPAAAKIDYFTPETTVTVHYGGLSEPAPVVFNWKAANGSATFDGQPVSAEGSKAVPPGYDAEKTYTLRVVGTGTPAEQTRTIKVTVDPVLAQMTGTTASGRSWMIDTIWVNGIPSVAPECTRNDVFTMLPNCKYQVNFGTIAGCPTGVSNFEYRFDPVTSVFKIINAVPAQEDRVVTFPSPTKMRHTYVHNGVTYSLSFVSV